MVLQLALAATHLPFAESQHAPVSLHGEPEPVQQFPPVAPHVVHVPLRHCWNAPLQLPVLATHLLFPGSQHAPVSVHVAFAQHVLPAAPHAVHVPPRHCWPAVLHAVFAATHLLLVGSQHAPAPRHAVPVAQQSKPVDPHGVHAPLAHVAPLGHVWPLATHVFVVGSQQEPGVEQVAPAQQAPPLAPHAVHVPPSPPAHTEPPSPQACVGATQRLSLGSQHAPGSVHAAPGQHTLPEGPQSWHVPVLHTMFVPAQLAPAPTQRCVFESQQPLLLHAPPKQHGSPGLPHEMPPSEGCVSGGASLAASAPPLESPAPSGIVPSTPPELVSPATSWVVAS
jgi:hypothetical protein